MFGYEVVLKSSLEKKKGDKWNIFVCLLSGNMHIHEELQLKNME